MKLKAALAVLFLLSTVPLLAQGNVDYVAIWHGVSNLFQSTIVFSWDPNGNPSGTIYSGVTHCPDGIDVPHTQNDHRNSFTFVPSTMQFSWMNYQEGTYEINRAVILSVNYGSPQIWEHRYDPSSMIATERGYWTVAKIPEPTALSLLALGVAALLRRGRLQRSII
jgi:hypothetical protein